MTLPSEYLIADRVSPLCAPPPPWRPYCALGGSSCFFLSLGFEMRLARGDLCIVGWRDIGPSSRRPLATLRMLSGTIGPALYPPRSGRGLYWPRTRVSNNQAPQLTQSRPVPSVGTLQGAKAAFLYLSQSNLYLNSDCKQEKEALGPKTLLDVPPRDPGLETRYPLSDPFWFAHQKRSDPRFLQPVPAASTHAPVAVSHTTMAMSQGLDKPQAVVWRQGYRRDVLLPWPLGIYKHTTVAVPRISKFLVIRAMLHFLLLFSLARNSRDGNLGFLVPDPRCSPRGLGMVKLSLGVLLGRLAPYGGLGGLGSRRDDSPSRPGWQHS
ncbi:hypothetical protein LX36DRAFT_201373 [Colletotrichum falcatum]|nr:hypothetical protein LX36DRAFT_201373 [Colletotrichum falcatum]